jgi:coproporphyrinogen III oxidase-like Fe-S oxidoreductase
VGSEQFRQVLESDVGGQPERRDLLLYVHIPFCSSKCSFCFWVAGISARELRSGAGRRAEYVDALRRQISTHGPLLAEVGYQPRYVYWGGGTPSILEPAQIHDLGEHLRRTFDLSQVEEYSVESSPETLSEAKIRALIDVGMTRLSIGVQSFQEAELRLAARSHSAEQATAAVACARDAGVGNLNLDLITGFPGQTPELLAATLDTTAELSPEHVTAYSYLPFANTNMGRRVRDGSLKTRSRGEQVRAYRQAREALTRAGYVEYMPEYFSRAGDFPFRCEQYYFDLMGDFVGFGSGAHSRIAHHLVVSQRGELDAFLASPTDFDSCEPITPDLTSAYHSTLLRAFRGKGRLDYERFREAYGFGLEALQDAPLVNRHRDELARRGRRLVMDGRKMYVVADSRPDSPESNRVA